MSDTKGELFESEWDATWKHVEAQPWQPDEQVVRFLSTYYARKVGFGAKEIRYVQDSQPVGLDLGCGKGRHLVTMAELGIETYGVDISSVGVEFAKEWMATKGLAARIEKSPISNLPFADNFFDFTLCHGVLDHMTLAERAIGLSETNRILKSGGLFFYSLISKNDSAYGQGAFLEENTWLIDEGFEKNAPQAFFDEPRIKTEFDQFFETVSMTLTTNKTLLGRSLIGTDKHYSVDERYYVVARKK